MTAPAAVGLDVGTAWTKIVTGGGDVSVVPTDLAPDVLARGPVLQTGPIAAFLGGVLGPRPPAATSVVVAVPDPWLGGPGVTPPAHRLRAVLADQLGFSAPRTVSELLCVAASRPAPIGADVQVLCDVGARSVAAAACLQDGRDVHMLAVEHSEDGAAMVDATLVDALVGPHPAAPGERGHLVRLLGRERRRHARRAELLLERLARTGSGRHRRDGPWETVPVYLLPGGRHLTAAAVAAAVAPLAAALRGVLERLAVRIAEHPVADEVVVTGGACGYPVVGYAVRKAFGDRAIVRLPSSTAARGAHAIATGRVHVMDDTPPTVRIAASRWHHGLLENATVEVPTTEEVELTVARRQTLALQLRGAGHDRWEAAVPGPPVPEGRYHVGVRDLRGGRAELVLQSENGQPTVVIPVQRRS